MARQRALWRDRPAGGSGDVPPGRDLVRASGAVAEAPQQRGDQDTLWISTLRGHGPPPYDIDDFARGDSSREERVGLVPGSWSRRCPDHVERQVDEGERIALVHEFGQQDPYIQSFGRELIPREHAGEVDRRRSVLFPCGEKRASSFLTGAGWIGLDHGWLVDEVPRFNLEDEPPASADLRNHPSPSFGAAANPVPSSKRAPRRLIARRSPAVAAALRHAADASGSRRSSLFGPRSRTSYSLSTSSAFLSRPTSRPAAAVTAPLISRRGCASASSNSGAGASRGST